MSTFLKSLHQNVAAYVGCDPKILAKVLTVSENLSPSLAQTVLTMYFLCPVRTAAQFSCPFSGSSAVVVNPLHSAVKSDLRSRLPQSETHQEHEECIPHAAYTTKPVLSFIFIFFLCFLNRLQYKELAIFVYCNGGY